MPAITAPFIGSESHGHAQLQRLMCFPDKHFKAKVCLSPYIGIEVDIKGNVRLCGCAAWMPSTVGNLFETSLTDILAGAESIAIRESIADGSYRYCDATRCGIINNGRLNSLHTVSESIKSLLNDSKKFHMPQEIMLAGDLTCNLSCPSCRTAIHKSQPEFVRQQEALGLILKKNLFSDPSDSRMTLHASTSGEIFASPLLMSFLRAIDVSNFPNLNLALQTNGLLMPHRWKSLGAIASRVHKITITIDAADEATYERLRRGGKWNDMLDCLAWVKAQKKSAVKLSIHMRMVVQKDNWQQVSDFYQLCKEHDADVVEYVRLENWGTYGDFDEFDKIDVLSASNLNRSAALLSIHEISRHPNVLLFGDFA